MGQERHGDVLREHADRYARVALACIDREYPVYIAHVASQAGAAPTHRARHPAFYGSFDWHSAVGMHWALVRLLRIMPDAVPEAEIRVALHRHFSQESLAREAAFFADPANRGFERPYGWGWLLALAHEIATWDDPDAQHWTENLTPLVDIVTTRFLDWLPKATYPARYGVHANSAFGLSRALGWARWRASQGDSALLDAMTDAAYRWFRDDQDARRLGAVRK